jgi:hypothetical protein
MGCGTEPKRHGRPVPKAKKLGGKRLPAVKNLTLAAKKIPSGPC